MLADQHTELCFIHCFHLKLTCSEYAAALQAHFPSKFTGHFLLNVSPPLIIIPITIFIVTISSVS